MIEIVCSECGSEDIVHDALASWSKATQAWVVADVLDNSICCDCELSGDWIEQRLEVASDENRQVLAAYNAVSDDNDCCSQYRVFQERADFVEKGCRGLRGRPRPA